MTPAELNATLRRLDMTRRDLGRLARVDESTVFRWLRPGNTVPGYVDTILEQHERLQALTPENGEQTQ